MRVRTSLFVGLAVVLAGVTLLAWRQSRELVAGRTMALNGDERAAFEARLAELRRCNRQLQAALTAVRSGSGGMKAGSAAKKEAEVRKLDEARLLASLAAGEARPDSKREEDLELLAALADLPKFQRMLALQQRGKIDAKFAGLFKKNEAFAGGTHAVAGAAGGPPERVCGCDARGARSGTHGPRRPPGGQ